MGCFLLLGEDQQLVCGLFHKRKDMLNSIFLYLFLIFINDLENLL